MWTIATPFANKPEVIPIWLECFKKLDFPRSEFKLVWVNMTKNPEITNLLEEYLEKYGKDFKEVVYIKDPQKSKGMVLEFPDDINHPRNLEKIASVTETMNIINSHRDGNLLVWEDDIIVPPNAWKRLKGIFDESETFKAVTGVQYFRKFDSNGEMLAWNWNVFREDGVMKYIINGFYEKLKGIESIGASAQGFTLYRKDFLEGYIFRSMEGFGPDIMACYDIKEFDKFPFGGLGKVILCWDMKFPHLGKDQEGKIKAYKSQMCTTEIPGKTI